MFEFFWRDQPALQQPCDERACARERVNDVYAFAAQRLPKLLLQNVVDVYYLIFPVHIQLSVRNVEITSQSIALAFDPACKLAQLIICCLSDGKEGLASFHPSQILNQNLIRNPLSQQQQQQQQQQHQEQEQ